MIEEHEKSRLLRLESQLQETFKFFGLDLPLVQTIAYKASALNWDSPITQDAGIKHARMLIALYGLHCEKRPLSTDHKSSHNDVKGRREDATIPFDSSPHSSSPLPPDELSKLLERIYQADPTCLPASTILWSDLSAKWYTRSVHTNAKVMIESADEHTRLALESTLIGTIMQKLGHSISIEYDSDGWRVRAGGPWTGTTLIGFGSSRLHAFVSTLEEIKQSKPEKCD